MPVVFPAGMAGHPSSGWGKSILMTQNKLSVVPNLAAGTLPLIPQSPKRKKTLLTVSNGDAVNSYAYPQLVIVDEVKYSR
jgi:hypothetical protein